MLLEGSSKYFLDMVGGLGPPQNRVLRVSPKCQIKTPTSDLSSTISDVEWNPNQVKKYVELLKHVAVPMLARHKFSIVQIFSHSKLRPKRGTFEPPSIICTILDGLTLLTSSVLWSTTHFWMPQAGVLAEAGTSPDFCTLTALVLSSLWRFVTLR